MNVNENHLPAGQAGIPGGLGGGPGGGRGLPSHAIDMGPGPGNGPRRRPPQYPSHQQQHSYNHHQQHANHGAMYYSQMNPYATSYYPQVQAHYQNGAVPQVPYMPYNTYQHQARSPPTMHQQYAPIVSSCMTQHPLPPQPYSRPAQQLSPAVSTLPPYQSPAPLAPAPIPQTPTSSHSSQAVPAPLTSSTQRREAVVLPADVEVQPAQAAFLPPLPWLSRPDLPFPARAARSRRRRRMLTSETGQVELPSNQQTGVQSVEQQPAEQLSAEPTKSETIALDSQSPNASIEAVERSETPSTQDVPSESTQSTSPTTPVSVQTTHTSIAVSVTPTKPSKPTTRAAAPAVPVVPLLPKSSPREVKATLSTEQPNTEQKQNMSSASADKALEGQRPPTETTAEDMKTSPAPASAPGPARAPAWSKPKSWANLFTPAGPNTSADARVNGSAATIPGEMAAEGFTTSNGTAIAGSFAKTNASSLAEALRSYGVTDGPGKKVAFLEPRGLINTGNMCYMNSVLQVLIFCIPFFDFLDQVGKKAAHSFKSETPLIDAMIMFMHEFKLIYSATVDSLGRSLKPEDYERYGEPFTPEFVYDAIRKVKRFENMKHGHQQDAQEFLGLLLESLHEECAHVMRHLPDSSTTATATNFSAATPAMPSPISTPDNGDQWLEVGRRQRAAVTRSSGHTSESSPITKIFGGQLRSELKVPGLKDSVTLEPYQPLQLDIDSPQVHNIVDALKNLTRPESIHGDFNSPRGRDVIATKQLFIESLPPVLILHLKRFQYHAEGTRTVKISKKVGYPLELELPKEVFSRQKRNTWLADGVGLPKYRLIATVYHHGKNASGGHYTVDVRRHDGRKWIRLDDTVIRRVRSEDVAEGGVEEDVNKQTTWFDNKKENVAGSSGNRFDSIGYDETGDDEGWNKVSAPTSGAKKWSSVVNGTANKATTQAKGNHVKENVKDNKMAYLLFYQRI